MTVRGLMVAGRTGEVPTLADVSSLSKVVSPSGGDRPQVAIKFLSNGRIQSATGDTGGALSFSNIGWWLDTDAAPHTDSDWEVKLTVDSSSGSDTGTYTGNSLTTFHVLSADVTWTLTKDDNSNGNAVKNITLDIRQVSKTTNSDTKTTIPHTVEITA